MNKRDKIILEIAAVENPLYFEHFTDCVWGRCRQLAGFEKSSTIYKHWTTLEIEEIEANLGETK